MSFSVTVIISTFDSRIESIVIPKFMSDISYLIVHQVSKMKEYTISHLERNDVRVLSIDRLGLSISRNIALANVATKYVYIMDDDVYFDSGRILDIATLMDKDCVDVSTAQFRYDNGNYPKNYKKHSFIHSMLSVAKVSSIEICVNIDSIRGKRIKFDEKFGLGTDLPSGEEYIFLADCLKAGLSVKYYPILIGVHPNITSGIDFYTDRNKTLAKREMLKRVFGWNAFFYIFFFWLKKTGIVLKYGNFFSFTKRILFGLKG